MDFSYPLLYLGPKTEKHANVPGRVGAIIFKQGPLSEQFGGKPYADVNEKEGRYLVRQAPDIFVWPEGTRLGPQLVTREEYDELTAKVQALETAVQALVSPPTDEQSDTPKAAGRRGKQQPAEPGAPASDEPPTSPEVKPDEQPV